MKPRREGGSLKADVTKIVSAIKAEKQYLYMKQMA